MGPHNETAPARRLTPPTIRRIALIVAVAVAGTAVPAAVVATTPDDSTSTSSTSTTSTSTSTSTTSTSTTSTTEPGATTEPGSTTEPSTTSDVSTTVETSTTTPAVSSTVDAPTTTSDVGVGGTDPTTTLPSTTSTVATTTSTTTTTTPVAALAIAAAAPAPTCYVSVTVRAGSSVGVFCVETRLRQLGLIGYGADSVLNATSVAAIRSFQSSAGLSVSGVASGQTLSRMGIWRAPAAATCTVSVVVRAGSTAGARCVETRLRQLGFISYAADDYFNSSSVIGLRKYQSSAGLGATGVASITTLTRLGIWRAPPAPSCTVMISVRLGSRVGARCVETRLRQLGFISYAPDDYFNSTSVTALRAYQRSMAQNATGIAVAATLRSLGIWRQPPAPTCEVHGTVMAGSRMGARCVETRLRQLGFISYAPDDYFNSTSVAALRAYQQAIGIPANGIAGQLTLQLLDILPMHMFIDVTRIPLPRAGQSVLALIAATSATTGDPFVGAFRTDCTFSHAAFDDPIVYPGQPGAAHLHAFYGNVNMNAYSTTADNGAASTCAGGTANRSGYWVPAMVDTSDGRPIVSNYLQIYYKTGYLGVPPSSVQAPPAGLRMVAGQAMTATTPDRSGHTYYYCRSDLNQTHHSSIPNCAAGDIVVMAVMFPQCWNGRDLDSADHRSHMAYPTAGRGCPSSHPVAIPEIIQHAWYRVPPGGTSTWRLASDMYDGPAGYTAHADWWNGWDRRILQTLTTNCWQARRNCQVNLLGDGRELRWFGAIPSE